jgi:flagellar M-ring protein FliF
MDWIDVGRRWGAVAGGAVMLLIFLRMLSRQKIEPVPVEVLSLPPDAAARALPSSAHVTPETLNELIRQRPANIGVALRDWVATNKN